MDKLTGIFLELFNMSVNASYIILAVLILRLIFKKAPKKLICMMWAIPAIRLICPFSFKSILSLLPSEKAVSYEVLLSDTPQIHSGINFVDNRINPVIRDNFTPSKIETVDPLQLLTNAMSILWIAGIFILAVFSVISLIRLKVRLFDAVKKEDNIYQSQNVSTPFILGVIKPKIYIPFNMDETLLSYVLAHEKAHLKRFDHIIKPIGFLILCIHWFNPLVWVAYALLCRDIEIACDQKVFENFTSEDKKNYANALLLCGVGSKRFLISACPLAFGEVGIKERIKNVMNYKKPALWIIVLLIIAAVVVAVCFLTSPEHKELPDTSGDTSTVTTPVGDLLGTQTTVLPDKSNAYAVTFKKLNIPYSAELENEFIDFEYFESYPGTYKSKVFTSYDEYAEFLSDMGLDTDGVGIIYDESYFEENILAIAGIYEGSGSIKHEVYDVFISDNHLIVSINAYTPYICTEDIQFYLMAAELDKSEFSKKDIQFIRYTQFSDEFGEHFTSQTVAVRTIYTGIFPQYCYANWNEDGINLIWNESIVNKNQSQLPIVKITSKEEFDEFYLKVAPFFTLDYEYSSMVDGTYYHYSPCATLEAVKDSTEEGGFFENNTLLLVYIPENSSSIYHSPDSVYTYGNTMYFNIRAYLPYAFDTAMAGWFMCYTVENELISGIDTFCANRFEMPYRELVVMGEQSDDILLNPRITLYEADKTFTMSISPVSSYMYSGSYFYDDGYLVLFEQGTNSFYRFRIDEEAYIFEADNSSQINLPDGTVFFS